MDYDPRLLPSFIALAEELHFGRAAARLHVAQSALSQQIGRLETQLGVALFVRHTRRVALSAAGQAFLAGARSAVASARQAALDARQAGSERRVLRIGVDIDVPSAIVRAIRRFGAGRPDLELRLTVQQQDDALRDLGAGRLHLAACWTGPPPGELLDAAPLVAVPLVGVVRRDDPLADGAALPRRALAERTLVFYEPSRETRAFYDFFLGAFGAPSAGPRVVHVPVLDDAQEAMLDAVESDGGFTLSVAGELERSGRGRLAARPFEPPLAADVWPRSRRPDLVDDLIAGVATHDGAVINARELKLCRIGRWRPLEGLGRP